VPYPQLIDDGFCKPSRPCSMLLPSVEPLQNAN
jgi:hypothetical protein